MKQIAMKHVSTELALRNFRLEQLKELQFSSNNLMENFKTPGFAEKALKELGIFSQKVKMKDEIARLM